MSDNQLALVKKDTVDVVAKKVREFQQSGELHFPANYSPENAMKSAWLILQSVTTSKNDGYKPALQACTKDSIANSLLDMVVQGLNPMKKQCYFIVYGNKLSCQRSYFGTMAVTKRVTGAKDIFAQVVYDGDEFEFSIIRGRKKVTKHVQTLKSINSGVIVGAYCTIILANDDEFTEFMTMQEIEQAWKMSKANPDSANSTHKQFPTEMAKKTVINRACKAYMNTADDSSLVMQHFNRADDEREELEVETELAEHANKTVIDAEWSESDKEPEPPKSEPTPEPKERSKHQKAQPEQQTLDVNEPGF